MARSMLNKDLLREIKATKNRFISIVLLVVIAVSFLYGLRIAAPDMEASMDTYLDEQAMYDIRILSTLGLTDDDVAAVAALDGIETVEGVLTIDAIASNGTDITVVVKAISLPQQGINAPHLIEGRLPENKTECVVEEKFITNTTLAIGDTIYLDSGDGAFADTLAQKEFTIVGVCNHPLYTSISRGTSTLGNGSVGAVVLLPAAAYSMDYYTDVYATVTGSAALNAYDTAYETLIEEAIAAVESIQADREAARTTEIKGEAQEELDEGWDEYREGEAEAKRKLDAAKAELDSAKAELNSGWSNYYSGLKDIAAGKDQIATAEAELKASQTELNDAKARYEEGLNQYKSGYAQWQSGSAQLEAARQQMLENGMNEEAVNATLATDQANLNAAKAELDANKAILDQTASQLSQGQAQIDAASQQLAAEKAKLEAGEAELKAGYSDLAAGQAQYNRGKSTYNNSKAEAEAELAEAKEELDEAQADIDAIEGAEWYVLDRSSNMGFAGYEQDAERMNRLANVIPIVFFLVAALVCLTGMTRMVEEQRIQIGGLKALGYSKRDIAHKYVGYGLLASLIGSVFGLVLGATLIPWIITECWKVMYDYPGVVLTFEADTALICVALAVACCAVAALAAVLTALRATPATLMRPKAPKAGKRVLLERIPFLWKRLSFARKVACRNLFRYKKRFWMTVIGIAGCTGLLLTGFGLYDSVTDIVDLQYAKVSSYSAVLYTDEDITEEEQEALYTALNNEEELKDYAPCYLDTVTLESDAYTLDGNLMAVDDPKDLEGFWDFHERESEKPLTLSDNGVILTEKTAELLELQVGDSITVVSDDRRGRMTVAGIMENYVNHYVFTTKDYCEASLGFRPDNTQTLLYYTETADWEAMGSRLLAMDSVTGIYYQKEAQDIVRRQLEGVYPAVIIIIIAAAALAFVVLFNLSSINITERRRELATLRVLGFRDKEMRDYVFRENIILTFLGIALGLFFGVYFHAFVMGTVEVDMVMFGRQIHTLSFILSVLMTLLFATVVNIISGKALAKIDMVESLKSVE